METSEGKEGEEREVVEATERKKYLRVYQNSKYHAHSPHWRCFDRIREEISPHPAYANFGCGSGLLETKLLAEFPLLKAILVDHVDVLGWGLHENPRVTFLEASLFGEIPRFEVPYAVSTDVMEHIPTEYVDRVLDSIRDRSESTFLQISLDPTSEKKANLYGGHLHLTVEEPDWWLARFRKHFSRIVTPQLVTHDSPTKRGWLAVTVFR